MESMVMAAPDPDAGQRFAELARALSALWPDVVAIHHIGSTAVPGLVAKPVLDVQVSVAALAAMPAAALAGLGLIERTGLADHKPPAAEWSDADAAKRFFKSLQPRVNLHVRVAGARNQRYALLCRDYLRRHPVAAQAYGLIKQRLIARDPQDEDFYYDIKDPVFDILMAGAEEWAAHSGWQLPASDG